MSAKLVKHSLWCFCFWFYLINLKVYMFLYFSRQWVLFSNGVKNVWLWVFFCMKNLGRDLCTLPEGIHPSVFSAVFP